MDRDSIHYLITSSKEIFEDRALVKPWLQSKLILKGINVAIERSDETKIVFKCKSPKRINMIPLDSAEEIGNGNGNDKGNDKGKGKEGLVLRKKKKRTHCPFRIRANFSVRTKRWSIVVVNENHNHPLFPINENKNDRNRGGKITDQPSLDLMNLSLPLPLPLQLPSSPSSPSSPSPLCLNNNDHTSLINNNDNNPQMQQLPNTSTSNSQISQEVTSNFLQSSRNDFNNKEKTLNELQAEFNNGLWKINCLREEEEVKQLYSKLLGVLNSFSSAISQNNQQEHHHQQQQPYTSSSSSTTTTTTTFPQHSANNINALIDKNSSPPHPPTSVVTPIGPNFGSFTTTTATSAVVATPSSEYKMISGDSDGNIITNNNNTINKNLAFTDPANKTHHIQNSTLLLPTLPHNNSSFTNNNNAFLYRNGGDNAFLRF
ncbi:hypothetical protein PACTADRAFT_185490 [Pachysolen tannophilus NRRL Y-2460]|uniref:Uncharacterized protein n=1 Tax=Pachysolen tannophilus NRRL Y-2460 TaxID=669874 RepID=A0A1E4U290_PACTA|nr:hypothetical protein PACTADRAFT_185490 [Pachysolen tannophilus NRRL Y-2460]